VAVDHGQAGAHVAGEVKRRDTHDGTSSIDNEIEESQPRRAPLD